MNQPSVYSYSQIIDTAIELIREQGWSAVSTRAIAKKLGSSTMPIYSHVRSMEELEKELRKEARKLLKSFQQRRYTDNILLNLAYGYVVFAKHEKNLFQFLFIESPETFSSEDQSVLNSFFAEFGEDSAEAKLLSELKDSGQLALVQYTWIFTHGLAMLVNTGAFNSSSDQEILRFLMNAGEAFYQWGIKKNEGQNSDNDK